LCQYAVTFQSGSGVVVEVLDEAGVCEVVVVYLAVTEVLEG
jgi:hypothetical protein